MCIVNTIFYLYFFNIYWFIFILFRNLYHSNNDIKIF